MDDAPQQPPVNRARRATYAYLATAASILAAVYISHMSEPSPVAERVAVGLLEIPLWVTVLYVGGSVADSTGFINGLVNRFRGS